MKYLILTLMILLGSCYEDDIKRASDKCQDVVNEATDQIWTECINFCEVTLQAELAELIDDFFKKLGCTTSGDPMDPASWDCSSLCQ